MAQRGVSEMLVGKLRGDEVMGVGVRRGPEHLVACGGGHPRTGRRQAWV